MSRHLERGFVLMELRRFADAACEFTRVAALAGEDGAVGQAALALAALHQNRPVEAARHVRAALAGAPEHPAVLVAAAAHEIQTGRPDRARAHLAVARRLLPQDPEILGLSALAECVARDPRAALTFAECGLSLVPDDALCLECAANAYHDLGERAGRDHYLARLRSVCPLTALPGTIAAREALGADDLPAARAHLAEALRLAPEDMEAHELRLRLAATDHWVYRIVAGRIGPWKISAWVRCALCFAPIFVVLAIGLTSDTDPNTPWVYRAVNPFLVLALALSVLLGWHAWWILAKGFREPKARRLGRILGWYLVLPALCAGVLAISQLLHVATGVSVAGLAFFSLFLCGTWQLGIDRPRAGLFRMPVYAWLHVGLLALAVPLQIAANLTFAGWPDATLLGLNLAALGAFLLLAPPADSPAGPPDKMRTAMPPPLPSARS